MLPSRSIKYTGFMVQLDLLLHSFLVKTQKQIIFGCIVYIETIPAEQILKYFICICFFKN